MRYPTALILLAFACPVFASQGAGNVQSVTFKTSVTPPVYRIPASLKKNEKVFRAGLEKLPEGMLVVGALLVGSGELGLSAKQSASLTPLMADTYRKIGADPAFADVPSALPYCFSTTRPKSGHYFLYRPKEIPKEPTCIVFLHGYGGNFQFYTWVLKEEFPEAVILAPSWSVSWYRGSATYLREMLADAEDRTGVRLARPWLMAISAGGRGGFLIYNRLPETFSGYVCLASAPETTTARRLRSDLRILMLNGTEDAMFTINSARRQAALAKRRVPTLRMQEIDGNHFFILSKREQTFEAIRDFMNRGNDHE